MKITKEQLNKAFINGLYVGAIGGVLFFILLMHIFPV